PVYRRTDQGLILVFKVAERPILRDVRYVGNEKIKEKELAGITGLQPMHAFSVATNREAARRILEHYKQKGFLFAEIELQQGGDPNDRSVVFSIKEGPKVRVTSIRFVGNEDVSSELLKLRLTTKKRVLWTFGGQYDPTTIPEDVVLIKKYYHNIGYFDAQVEDKIDFSEDQGSVVVTFNIKEGPRYKIRNIEIEGNEIYSEEQLRQDFEVEEGDFFSARDLAGDVSSVQEKYGQLGRLFAKVNTQTVFTKEQGVVDLRLTIDEDRVYRVGMINVHIRGQHSHTKETVALNQMLLAPGDLADPEKIRKSRARFAGASTWESGGPEAPEINIQPVVDPSYLAKNDRNSDNIFRGADSYFGSPSKEINGIQPLKEPLPQSTAVMQELVPTSYQAIQSAPAGGMPAVPGAGHTFIPTLKPEQETYRREERLDREQAAEPLLYQPIELNHPAIFAEPTEPFVSPMTMGEQPVIRGQNYDNYNDPPNMIYSQTPQGDLLGPQFQNPQLPPGYVDLDVYLSEARTGRFMVGAGVNSDSGVVGNIVLEEQNFDITRFPRSFRDVADGYAFRGGGQQFRLEATPGSQVSRYLASWTDPYFMDTDYSLGVSGFYYERFFRDWHETRLGGRINVGKLLTRELSFNTALRLEQVDVSSPRFAPGLSPSLDEIVGNNFLGTGRFTLAYDTRDSSYMATEGFNLSSSLEQAFADYDFTKIDLQGSQYFTVYQRPDGGGKHVLSMRGNVGWTTDDTPAFERYYAGGFQTFRGFQFRSVTPLEPDNLGTNGAAIGGYFQTLGTVEYMLPVMANEALRVVAFSDFGTVDRGVSLQDFRVSVGAGLRITVPQMGPVPIALDWAFPVVKQDTDIRQIFSFYIGLTR
ncbi:MAG: BamA/TamA family outer membrane protein, partial [Planctomycetaceae bacterium]|nr:BamA/TamA family outer membrane protein [Planctomycetaceae bacterium]